ncbi:MAG: TraR/DksA family transcriptional regulator [Candidatus Methylomirabilales bacterium]
MEQRTQALAAMLQRKRREIRAEMDTLAAGLRAPDVLTLSDQGDRAAEAVSREIRSARLEQLGRMLRQVDQALAQHARAEYGRCQGCEGEIAIERLRSLPFAVFCRPCQEALEAGLQPGSEDRAEVRRSSR